MLCRKPLYRRPYELAKVRYAACMNCRSAAQKVAGITTKQQGGLSLGRVKGTNHRAGYRHKEESKALIGEANKRFWAENPEKVRARGEKLRGEAHYRWNGGVSRLNASIRRMTENRRWMDAVKGRDAKCIRCGSVEELEAHHIVSLADLIAQLGIGSREDARQHASRLWCLGNGETLCRPCHYQEHGRTYAD